jgi:hypothetical protein
MDLLTAEDQAVASVQGEIAGEGQAVTEGQGQPSETVQGQEGVESEDQGQGQIEGQEEFEGITLKVPAFTGGQAPATAEGQAPVPAEGQTSTHGQVTAKPGQKKSTAGKQRKSVSGKKQKKVFKKTPSSGYGQPKAKASKTGKTKKGKKSETEGFLITFVSYDEELSAESEFEVEIEFEDEPDEIVNDQSVKTETESVDQGEGRISGVIEEEFEEAEETERRQSVDSEETVKGRSVDTGKAVKGQARRKRKFVRAPTLDDWTEETGEAAACVVGQALPVGEERYIATPVRISKRARKFAVSKDFVSASPVYLPSFRLRLRGKNRTVVEVKGDSGFTHSQRVQGLALKSVNSTVKSGKSSDITVKSSLTSLEGQPSAAGSAELLAAIEEEGAEKQPAPIEPTSTVLEITSSQGIVSRHVSGEDISRKSTLTLTTGALLAVQAAQKPSQQKRVPLSLSLVNLQAPCPSLSPRTVSEKGVSLRSVKNLPVDEQQKTAKPLTNIVETEDSEATRLPEKIEESGGGIQAAEQPEAKSFAPAAKASGKLRFRTDITDTSSQISGVTVPTVQLDISAASASKQRKIPVSDKQEKKESPSTPLVGKTGALTAGTRIGRSLFGASQSPSLRASHSGTSQLTSLAASPCPTPANSVNLQSGREAGTSQSKGYKRPRTEPFSGESIGKVTAEAVEEKRMKMTMVSLVFFSVQKPFTYLFCMPVLHLLLVCASVIKVREMKSVCFGDSFNCNGVACFCDNC